MEAKNEALASLVDHDDHGWKAHLDEGVLHLTLSRPPVNAINTPTWRRLNLCIDRIYDDPSVRAVVITSDNPKIFSAGQDYKDVRDDDGGDFGGPNDRRRFVRDALAAIYQAPVPTVVGARGAVIGSGAVLASLVDLVVGGPGTTFTLPEIDRGIVGGSRFLARLVPEPLMRKMILLGEPVRGEDMHRLGSFAEFVPDDQIVETALDVGRRLAAKHPVVMRLMKQANIEVEHSAVMEGYAVEQMYSVTVPTSVRDELIPGLPKENQGG